MTVLAPRIHRSDAAACDAARTPLLPVVGADLQAPLVTGGSCRYVNLDYAASAPALVSVAEQVGAVLPTYASVHRGAGYASQVTTALYEHARAGVGTFVGARADDVTVITRNTTDSLNLLAGCVPEGGRVVVLDLEHHANGGALRADPGADPGRPRGGGDQGADRVGRRDGGLERHR